MSVVAPPNPAPAAPPAYPPAVWTVRTAAGELVPRLRMHGRLVSGAGADHGSWVGLSRALAGEIVLDLTGVVAIDAAGVGRLLRTRERLAARGARLTIRAASSRVRRVLDLTGVSPLFATVAPRPR